VPGCSNWFGLGWVTYSNQAKISQLGVRASTLERYGAVSQQTVHAMAQGALKVAEADLSIAVSGIAGPGGGTPDKPVGTVHFAWATVHEVVTQQLHLTGDRQHIRQQAVIAGLLGALRQL
jgi:nicotinamide-nucleotide amidase